MGSDTTGDNEVLSPKGSRKPVSNEILSKLKARKSGAQDGSAEPASPTSAKSKSKFASKDNNAAADDEQEDRRSDDSDGNAEINRQTLDHFHPAPGAVEASQATWKVFLARYSSREAAGEAIFQALFETAPSLQSLFTSSRAVQAMKFMIALNDLISFMSNAEVLQAFVETLGFQHLHLQMTSVRVAIFRDAVIDVLTFELGDSLSPEAKSGLTALLNYVGGGLIYVRTHYADRLRILNESWAYCTAKASTQPIVTVEKEESDHGDSDDGDNKTVQVQLQNDHGKQGKGWRQMFKRKGPQDNTHVEGTKSKEESSNNNNTHEIEKNMPTTFAEMFKVNCAVMGMSISSWMAEVLEVFDALVVNVANGARMKEESDILALRLSKHDQNEVNLPEFKACMLAALRSLLPKQWSTAHETAWSWMWDNVARLLDQNMSKPPRQEAALNDFLESMDEAALYSMRKDVYIRFFGMTPIGQLYFKQSNTRLHFIAERVTFMTLELFRDPKRMVQQISALGLRHVEFGIPTDLFAPFVSACVEVMCTRTQDETCLEAYRWSLGLISRILVRTINEGSTLVMKAINANSIKQLRKAIDSAPRRDRDAWFLDIQVGAQSISPLSWAIESGGLEVAKAVIKDLLTIRSDRENYYFGAPMLFSRHPDIVKRLVEDAPMLLPTLLDGLVWRSHRPEGGMRRVTYYQKHLLVNEAGDFADALKWLAATGDPAIIAHPVVGMVSDTLWTGVVYRAFIALKMWNILGLVVFMLSQGIFPRMIASVDTDRTTRERLEIVVFAGRLFTYTLGMGRLAMFHLARIWTWLRSTLKRIFDEIDEDGSGSIDWEEFKEAMKIFKDTIKAAILKALPIGDDEGPALAEDNRKGIATQSKSMYNIISFVLMIFLAIMLTHEPMLWCMRHEDWPTMDCSQASAGIKYRYSIFSCGSLVIHWLILVDLAVFSTEISAFLLVCGHVMGEVKTFLTALSFLLFTFGSSMPIFCIQGCSLVAGNFSSMPRAIVSLFAITLGWFEADDVMEIRDSNRMLLFVLMVFVGLSVILLLNLLIAQLNQSYEYIYQDMLGFARLNRASLIVEAMNSCAKSKWIRFRDSCGFDEKLEFDPGDLGLAGGIQVLEFQGHGDVLEDQILRFGGSTSLDMPWPEDKSGVEEQDDRFDRLELLMQKAIKRMGSTKNGGAGKSGGSGHEDSDGGSSQASEDESVVSEL